MPAYKLQLAEQQEDREELKRQLDQEVQGCTEVRIVERNHVKKFLMEYDVWHLSEIDYPLRLIYEDYVEKYKIPYRATLTCLHTFDKMKLHAIREEMQTMAGRRKHRLKYEDKLMFLPYETKIEIAEQLAKANNKAGLVWDFAKQYSRKLKQQMFECLDYVMSAYNGCERKEKLTALHYLYEYCVKAGIIDLELITLKQEKDFSDYLPQNMPVRKHTRFIGVIEICRRRLFLQADQIHWHAQVWYLERFHFSKERINLSKKVESVSFLEIIQEENRKYLKEYMRYTLGITYMTLSSIQIKFLDIRKFLQAFDGEDMNICEVQEEKIHLYLEELRKEEVAEKTFNGRLFSIRHFFSFLLVKGYIRRIPFLYEMYQKKEIPVHHDRSVREEVCVEILSKLYRFPEHLRLMFLHLWCAGLRCSEVCTLHGDAYEWKNGDAWIKVYQIKMKTYKRIPIPEMLYKLMGVYIEKYQIQPEEYLFKNKNGGAYLYATFRMQMLRLCSENQIAGGEYLFKSHDYRHTVATEYYESGVSIQAVRDYLGHDYEDMTRQYIDYMPRRLDAANEEFFSQQGESLAAGLRKGGADGGSDLHLQDGMLSESPAGAERKSETGVGI